MNRCVPLFTVAFVILMGCIFLLGWLLDIPLLKNNFFTTPLTMKPNIAFCFLLVGVSLALLQQRQLPLWLYPIPNRRIPDDRQFVLSTAIDITNRKQAQEALVQINASLEMRVRERTKELAQMNQRLERELLKREETQKELRLVSQRLQYLLTASPAVIFSSKPDGDYGATFISENVTEILGYKPRDFLDNSDFWRSHVHPEDIESLVNNIPQVLVKNYYSHQYRFLRADGTYCWLQAHMKLVRDEIGNPVEIVGYFVDITERKMLEMEVAYQQQLLNGFISGAPVGMAVLDSQLRYTFLNEAFAQINGIPAKEHIGKTVGEIAPDLTPKLEEICQQVLTTSQPILNVEITGVTQKFPGVLQTWLVSCFPINDSASHPIGFGFVIAEITQRREAEIALQESNAMLRAIGDNLPNGAIYQVAREVDNSIRFYYISAGIENIFEVKTEDALTDASLINQFIEDDYTKWLQAIDESIKNMSVLDIQLRIQTPSGKLKWLHFRSTPRCCDDKRIVSDGLVVDITEIKQAEEALWHLATQDELTQIANRRRFDDYLKQEWLELKHKRAPLSLILCDVDFFKDYNDTYGHPAGDACLVQIAQAIRRAVKRPADLVARYGGEEFAVILPNTDSGRAVEVVHAIQEEIRQQNLPHRASVVAQSITLSFGIATTTFPTHNASAQTLIDAADRALYRAKNKGRNCYQRFIV